MDRRRSSSASSCIVRALERACDADAVCVTSLYSRQAPPTCFRFGRLAMNDRATSPELMMSRCISGIERMCIVDKVGVGVGAPPYGQRPARDGASALLV